VPLLLFILALLLWEMVALFVANHSFGAFLRDLGDPLVLMAVFFNGLYALPIVLYVAIAHAVSQQFKGQVARLLTFVGLCCVGSLGLVGLFMNSTNLPQLRENGFAAFLVYPTLCVFALYLGRSFLQQPTR
jgi:hypothetical protein